MGIGDITLNVSENETGALIDIVGDDCSLIIGKKGETLDSLQYLTSLVCNKGEKEYFRISLDTCGYREKRKAQLEELAAKIAKSVLRSNGSTALEPMNPYERRIIHSVISGIEGVNSRSVGDEPHRKVIIASANRRFEKKGGNNNRNNNNNNNNNKNFKKRNDSKPKTKSFDFKTSFEKDYKKPRPEDNLNSGLYSKIEF